MQMEPFSFKVPANTSINVGGDRQSNDEVEAFQRRVNEMSHHVLKLDQKVQEIENFFSNNPRKQLKDKGRPVSTRLNQPAASNRMQDLINQFRTIFNQLTQRKIGHSSVDSFDVDDLGLHDFPEVSGKPKDLSSVSKRMEAQDGSGYTDVRDAYADVRFVLKNAMKYNDEKSDAHVTANTLLEKFAEKWFVLLPKIMQEVERGKTQIAKEVRSEEERGKAQMAKEVRSELCKVDLKLKELKECVLQKCRRISTLEKRELGRALTKLSADDLTKALEIVYQENPGSFQTTAEEVDLDIDALSESTLWRLKHFVVDILKAQGNNQSNSIDGYKNEKDETQVKACKANLKRKSETPKALVKPTKKKTKKVNGL